ncbi:MAG TPA: MBL fold metallo-hydrolase, partial [Sphaerochaeta sp.]|nr:MBL fold metallo-hydrolase [Sphaerochaeta sp.]
MFVERIVVGPYQTNCYIMGNEENSSAWIIDPGNEGNRIIKAIENHNITPVAVLLTHTHWDHITALGEMKKRWPHLEVLVSEEDSHFLGAQAYERFS